MFCSKCGKRNEDNAKFCYACGNNLEQDKVIVTNIAQKSNNNLQEEYIEKNRQRNNRKIFVSLGAIAILALAGVGGFFLTNTSSDKVVSEGITMVKSKIEQCIPWSSPEKVVCEYVTAIGNKNYSAVYKYLDIKETAWLNKENFVKAVEDLKNTEVNLESNPYRLINDEVKNVECQINATGNDKKLSCMVTVALLSGESVQIPLKLKVVEGSGLLPFVKDYKVISEDIYDDVSYRLPVGTVLKINDLEITDKKIEDNWEVYKLDNLFLGKYVVKISHPLYEDLEKVFVNKYDANKSNDEEALMFLANKLVFKADVNKNISDSTKCFISDLLEASVKKDVLKEDALASKEDDSIKNMLQKITDYCHKKDDNPIANMTVENGELAKVDVVENRMVNVEYNYQGKYYRKNTTNDVNSFSGSIQAELLPVNDQFIVSKINKYTIRMKK